MLDDLVTLLAHVGALGDRRSALTRIAEQCGGRGAYVFVPHPDMEGKLLPATGFACTLPSSRGWRDLLDRCRNPGTFRGPVAFPTATETAPAVAYAYPGVVIVLVGREDDCSELHEALDRLSPLLTALLRAERDTLVARGDLAVAKQQAERSDALARALDLARNEAQQATRAKDEFLAMLGHELRNPLAPIVTALQVLRMNNATTRVHEVLERQVGHLQRLVDDLLDVSRITRGKVDLRREVLEIGTVITRAVEMARPLLEQKQTRLEIAVAAEGLTIDGDPARLAQVFSNLITNAAKYSDAGSRIRIIAEHAGTLVRVTVEDRGIGIDPALLDRVFERFMQVPQGIDRAAGGLGLGLAIVRSLVNAHAGCVRASSEGVGKGSSFIVELPFHDGAPSIAAPAEVQPPLSVGKHAQILVVDDNRDAAELLADVLGAFSYDVRIAHDGPAALTALETFRPVVAILDIGLPVMDGYELAGEVRSRIPEVRLIAVTGYGQASDREKTTRAGFDAHLVKPVTIARVQETLSRLLD
ncbi:MAG: response regulator [Deltaproteobacteria bacterium]|nr:response regulator [Deltaproteobacteria bacterium]